MAKTNRTYRVDTSAVATFKTPQLATCVKILLDTAVDGKVTEDDLRAALELRKDELHTRQDTWLIFQYYRPQMLKCGLVAIDGRVPRVARVPGSGYWDYPNI